jgi:crotonobetainyl-CoA:carnitine CoA-transferase CaiB-like acyl-CoA transferase
MSGTRPLAGVRVVDLVVGGMARVGRILSDLGAEVAAYRSGSAASLPAAADDRLSEDLLSIGKVVHTAGEAFFRDPGEVLARADILLLDGVTAQRPGFGERDLRAAHPSLTVMSITDFGLDSPFHGWAATEGVLHALSGTLARSGIKGREPLLPPGYLATGSAAVQAVGALLVALYSRLRTGRGEFIDFSTLDGACHALDPGYGVAGSAFQGRRPSDLPRHRPPRGTYYPIIACRDGWVRICVLAVRQWRALFDWMGKPPEFADPRFDATFTRLDSAELLEAMKRFFADKTRESLEAEGERRGIPIASVRSLSEALASVHAHARRSVTTIDLDGTGPVAHPRGCTEVDGEVLSPRPDASANDEPGWVANVMAANPRAGRPLAELRVLDLGVIVAGAESGRLFADQGADVVKVESAAYPDGQRQTRSGSPISNSVAVAQRNKRSLGLNLRSSEGRALFLQLAAKADVILSNFKPGTLEALGIGHDAVAAVNPAIVMVESSAFGNSGPWRGRMGYGPLVRAASGLTDRWRYEGDAEGHSDAVTVYPDHISGRRSFVAAMALLIRRCRTGRGGKAAISQLDAIFEQCSEEIARLSLGRPEVPARAPWGVYPCRGDDAWCVITVRGDDEWRRLAAATGLPDTPSRATAPARLAQRDAIDEELGRWTATRTPDEVMQVLQADGIPAAGMLRVPDLPDHPHFIRRLFFRQEQHPMLDEPFLAESSPAGFRSFPPPPSRPAPLAAQDTASVMSGWLGLSPADIDRLLAEGVLEASVMPATQAAE